MPGLAAPCMTASKETVLLLTQMSGACHARSGMPGQPQPTTTGVEQDDVNTLYGARRLHPVVQSLETTFLAERSQTGDAFYARWTASGPDSTSLFSGTTYR